MVKDGEIVGLKGISNERSCVAHACCGEHLSLDELVRFRLCIVDVDGKMEEGIAVVRIRDGSEACTVGFLPRNIVRSSKDKFNGKFAQIIELYESSECAIKRRKSNRNQGMASFRLLNDIPKSE